MIENLWCFHIFFLKSNTIKKKQVDKKIIEQLKFQTGSNNKKYNIKNIYNSIIYDKKLEKYYLLYIYYLISWKSYYKDKNTQKSISIVQHLRKLVSAFYKIQFNELIATSLLINSTSLMAKYTALLNINSKQKYVQLIGSIPKKTKYQPTIYQ